MSVHAYRLPDHGKWHDTLDDVEPGARPNRPREPARVTRSQRRRKRAVARRSRERLAPGSAYFYWCEHCDYCNTSDEGVTARCANHRRTADASRKAEWRSKPTEAVTPATPVLSDEQIVLLWQRGRALHIAWKDYDIAVRQGMGAMGKAPLDEAIAGVLETISGLPKRREGRR